MKKISLLFPLFSLLLAGCATFQRNDANPATPTQGEITEGYVDQTSGGQTGGQTEIGGTQTGGGTSETGGGENTDKNEYKISKTSLTLVVEQEYKLYVTCDGVQITDVLWKTNNLDVALAKIDGTIVGIGEGEARIEAFINSSISLYCDVTVKGSSVTPPPAPPGPIEDNDSEIVKFFKNNADYANEEEDSYFFISVKTQQTYIWDFMFEYDTKDDICIIRSQMNGTYSTGEKYYYYGYNAFYWGDYKNGLFGGGYCQETAKGSNKYAEFKVSFDNSSIVFHNNKELLIGYELRYSIDQNDFSSAVTSDDAIAVFARVQECCSYAKEMFTKFNVNLSLY